MRMNERALRRLALAMAWVENFWVCKEALLESNASAYRKPFGGAIALKALVKVLCP